MNIVPDITDKLTMLQDDFGEEEAVGEAENSDAPTPAPEPEPPVEEEADEGTEEVEP